MMNLDYKLKEFESVLMEYTPLLYSKLLPPLENTEMERLFHHVSIDDMVLSTMYKWKNGIPYDTSLPTNVFDFCSMGVMLPLEFISKLYGEGDYRGDWEGHYFPLIGNYAGDYLLYNSDKNSDSYGMLYLYSPSLLFIDEKISYHDSIESMIQSIIECFRRGAYNYDEKRGGLDADIDLQYEIYARLNPKSSYWDDYR